MKIIIIILVLMSILCLTWLMMEDVFKQACYEKYDRSFKHRFIWYGFTKGYIEVCEGSKGEIRIM